VLSIKDVADMIASLHIADADHIWIGKLQDKADKSIGIYPLRRSGMPRIPIGGRTNTDHDIKQISMLIHWNKNVVETEEVAATFFNAISNIRGLSVNDQNIMFCRMLVPEAVPVGTDENNIYEYVIEFEIYYERKGE
jgi:hypothetical protein